MRTKLEVDDHVRLAGSGGQLADDVGDWAVVRELQNNVAVIAAGGGEHEVPIGQLTLVSPKRGPYPLAPPAHQRGT